VRIFTLDGREITSNNGTSSLFSVPLDAGTYLIEVGPLSTARPTDLSYRLRITLGTSLENAVALTTGAAPPYAIGLQRGSSSGPSGPSAPTSSPAPPTTLTLPSTPGADGVAPATTATASAAGGAPTGLSLPSGALTGLSAAPVGGVGAADAAAAPVAVAQLSLPATSAAAPAGVQFAGLSSSSAGGDTTGGSDGLGGAILQVLRVLERLRGVSVDRVFDGGAVAGWLSSWLRGLHVPLTLPDVAAPATETAPVPGAEEGAADEAPDPSDASGAIPERPVQAPDWLWASGLLAAGGLAVGPAARERRRIAARLRRSV
jgi:hypothetical protein